MRGVRVVGVQVGVVRGHQGAEDVVVGQEVQQHRSRVRAVLEPAVGQGPVQVAVCGLVRIAALEQRRLGRHRQGGPGVGGDLVQRPDRVEVADVAVCVLVGEGGPGPFLQCAVAVDQVGREPVEERGPLCDSGLLDAEQVRHRDRGLQGVLARGDVHGGVDAGVDPGVGRGVLRREGGHEHVVAVAVGLAQKGLVEQRQLVQPGPERPLQVAGVAVHQAVLVDRVEQPVRASGPHLAGEAGVEVQLVAVAAVGAGAGQDPVGAVDIGGVGLPLRDLAEDHIVVGGDEFGHVADRSPGHLQVDVGVGGEVVRPGRAPFAQPEAGQPGRHVAAGAEEVVAPGIEHLLEQCRVQRSRVRDLLGDQRGGRQGPVGRSAVQVDGHPVVDRLVDCGVPVEKRRVRG